MSAPRLRTPASLPVRNAVAEAILEALGGPGGGVRLARARAALAAGEPPFADVADADRAAACARLDAATSALTTEAGRAGDTTPLGRALRHGSALFAAGLFFEVHEVLEEVWLDLEGADRTFVQGLIQIAVGLHHLAHANVRGARALLGEGRAKTAPSVPRRCGVDVAGLLATLGPWETAADDGRWPEDRPLPTFHIDDDR